MYIVFLAIPLLVIIIFLVLRLKFHFNTCQNVSEKNPGEKLSGCPDWTLVDKEDDDEVENYIDEK
ncbi:hypothetical protein [Natranaerofaba carboxydovora]|uniref:hypothetical protein n=1 Tax=Natranaerofaba carboxydovora TaxID=2742683 RepID=UPI001F12FD9B|nr:hypothetical protein [Natranaerofaba carboxydovora]UMZ73430.1 hypothetical protein ACONDI_00984 [Natranaerofaba carboxydovora]